MDAPGDDQASQPGTHHGPVRLDSVHRYLILEGIAASDQEARTLYLELVDQRRTSMQGPALGMFAASELKPGLTAEMAADLMWLYNDPTVFDKLVRQRGWSIDQFRAWLTRTLQMHLLRTAP